MGHRGLRAMLHLFSQTAGRLGPSSSSTPSVHTREKKPHTECQISVDNGFTGTEYRIQPVWCGWRSKPESLQDCRRSSHSSLWIHLCPRGTLSAGELFYKCVKKRVVLIVEIYVWGPCFRAVLKWVEIIFKKEFKQSYPTLANNAFPTRHGLLNENLSASRGLFPYQLLVRKVPKCPKQNKLLPLLLFAHHN